MRLESTNGNSVMAPLKLSSVLEQKLVKVESHHQHSKDDNETVNEEEFDNDADVDDADDVHGQNEILAGLLKESKQIDKSDCVDVGETEEDTTSSNKKKSTRKKRSMNWEEAERSLLMEVIKPKVDCVENRSVDAKTIKTKRLAWIQISKQFNSLNFRQRSLEQIQVQWRSIKNFAKKEYLQKHSKSNTHLEGMQIIEFMEEIQKELVGVTRSQTRSLGIQNKKDAMEIDEEDTPLAALPHSVINNSNSEDTLPSSTIALPSPPNSAESQLAEFQQSDEISIQPKRKKIAAKQNVNNTIKTKSRIQTPQPQQNATVDISNNTGFKVKRQKNQNSTNSDTLTTNLSMTTNTTSTSSNNSNEAKPSTALTLSTITTPPPSPPIPSDEKYKKKLFELVKQARLAEMEYARKEHEQKLRFERQEQELKIRQMCELHEQRMRFALAEHETRMQSYNIHSKIELQKSI